MAKSQTCLFYFQEGGNNFGPFNIIELYEIGIEKNSILSMDRMASWVKASSIEGLLETISLIKQLTNSLDSTKKDLETVKDNLSTKTKELTEKEIELSTKTKKLSDLEKELKKELEKGKSLEDYQIILQQKNDLEESVKKQKKAIAQKDTEIEAASKTIAELQKQVEKLRKEGEEKTGELAELKAATELVSSFVIPYGDQAANQQTTATDLIANHLEKYDGLKAKVQAKVTNLKALLPKERKFQLVFSSPEDESNYYLDAYNENIRVIFLIVEQLSQCLAEVKEVYDEDIRLLDSSYDRIRQEEEEQQQEEMKKIDSETNMQVKELEKSNLASRSSFIKILKTTLITRKQEIVQRGIETLKQKTSQLSQTKDNIKIRYEQLVDETLKTIEDAIGIIDKNYTKPLDQLYSLAYQRSDIWKEIKAEEQLPPTTLLAGSFIQNLPTEGRNLNISKRYFFDFLNKQNLIVRYNKSTKNMAMMLANSLMGRLLASSTPGLVNISIFDTEELGGTSNVLNKLKSNVYNLYVKEGEVKKALEWMRDYIADIKINLLQSPINNLQEYNLAKETKQPYHVLVFKGFPQGLRGDTVSLLNSIMKNGISTGVHVILLTDEDAIQQNSGEAQKIYDQIQNDALNYCMDIDINQFNNESQGKFRFDLLSDDILHTIVKYINGCFEVKEDEIIRLVDYVPAESDWWQGKSSKQVSIPFGLTSERKVAKLQITQKDAQNTAIIIGKPGSGKSVFLHSVICNAIVNYSPEELSLYLIDFSGVEFNTYALHKIPHARVIAPEAEREFGLSILDELVEEGGRRVSLCNQYNVSNIVDLKKANPEIKMPRILVIIDEFQKLFEVDDKINVYASTRLHIIIKEFRKFGINLILATQSLRACSGLPIDLIANRILFKSAPDDFSRLITLPSGSRMPLLKNGECIYNDDSGSPYANVKAKGFFIGSEEIEKFLGKMSEFNQKNGTHTNDLRVFRANELPDFVSRRIEEQNYPSENPKQIGIYFGESITISDTDVNVQLKKEGGNNILIMGGEQDVAQRISYYATLSATAAYTDIEAAKFYVFNFIREVDKVSSMNAMISGSSSSVVFATKKNEVTETLKSLADEVRRRKAEDDQMAQHIFLSFYAIQFSTAFDPEVKGTFNTVSQSEASKALEYILKEGPSLGVFTILQTDNLESIKPVGSNIQELFNYRIALQMSENESFKIVGSSLASQIYDMKRPSSKFRAYCRDKVRNTDIKFKPYN